nr:unnamed protein product [Haemonchus contortus]
MISPRFPSHPHGKSSPKLHYRHALVFRKVFRLGTIPSCTEHRDASQHYRTLLGFNIPAHCRKRASREASMRMCSSSNSGSMFVFTSS